MSEFSMAQQIAIYILPVMFAITVHEVAHGWVASKFGDQTARFAGRLTLNPFKHIDLVGTIIVPLLMLIFTNFIFGWAKPVPVDVRNLRNPRRDMALVGLAGPFSNLLMALAWAAIAKLGLLLVTSNQWLAVPLIYMGQAGIFVNVVLGVLNLLPIPPLDGGKVMMSILPGKMAWHLLKFEPYAFIILVVLILTNILSVIILPPISYTVSTIFWLFGL